MTKNRIDNKCPKCGKTDIYAIQDAQICYEILPNGDIGEEIDIEYDSFSKESIICPNCNYLGDYEN